MLATDGDACCVAKWCSSHCPGRQASKSSWSTLPSVGSWLSAHIYSSRPALATPTSDLKVHYVADDVHLDIAVPEDKKTVVSSTARSAAIRPIRVSRHWTKPMAQISFATEEDAEAMLRRGSSGVIADITIQRIKKDKDKPTALVMWWDGGAYDLSDNEIQEHFLNGPTALESNTALATALNSDGGMMSQQNQGKARETAYAAGNYDLEGKPKPGELEGQERILARSPSVGGLPATDGDACCVAKWCSSHCLVQQASMSSWSTIPSVGSRLSAHICSSRPESAMPTPDLTVNYAADDVHLDIAVPDDDDDFI